MTITLSVGDVKQWHVMPSMCTTRTIRAAMFLLPFAVTSAMMLGADTADGMTGSLIGVILISMVSGLLLGFTGATHLLEFLRRRGAFGTIRLDGMRLHVGRSGDSIEINSKLEAEVRKESITLERHVFNPRSGRHGRLHKALPLDVSVFAARLSQDRSTCTLFCDHATVVGGGFIARLTSPKVDPYDVDGLNLLPLPSEPPTGRVMRLRPCDVVEVIRLLQEARGWPDNEATASDASAAGHERDPRKIFASLGKTIVNVTVLAAITLGIIYGLLSHHAGTYSQQIDKLAEQQKDMEARLEPMVGKWVGTRSGFRDGEVVYGWVTGYRVEPPNEYVPELGWQQSYYILVTAFGMAGKPGYLPDTTEPLRSGSEPIRKGMTIRAAVDKVTPADPPPGVEPPPSPEAQAVD